MPPIDFCHIPVSIIKRSEGRSAVAAAAYRSGTKLTNEWDGLTHDYTRKGGVVPVSYTHLDVYKRQTQHRIRAEAVLTLITDMLRAIAEYSKNDRAEFIRTVQETQAAQQTADISKKRKRLAAAQKRAGEL